MKRGLRLRFPWIAEDVEAERRGVADEREAVGPRELDALMQALGAGDEATQQKQLLAQVLGLDTAGDEVGRE